MDTFKPFGKLVHDQLKSMFGETRLFVVTVPDESLFNRYLASFPEGTNPIYRTKTEHDCNCCRNFVKNVGHVVALKSDGSKITVWDKAAESNLNPYAEISKKLQAIVREAPVQDVFVTTPKFAEFGKEKSILLKKENGTADLFYHFYTGVIPKKFIQDSKGTYQNKYRTAAQVLDRGLRDFRLEALEMVSSLIENNAIYRGAEFANQVSSFHSIFVHYHKLAEDRKNAFGWSNVNYPAAMFRNTVIGTLVQDLSEGVELEKAVASFEHKVAPTNYKRTTALVTPGMIKKALETIQELGLEQALERRFARINDVSVNDVIWVDNKVKPLMKGNLEELLLSSVNKKLDKEPEDAEDISLDNFIKHIVPETTGMHIWFSNEHVGNMMSLTAPVHEDSKSLFKWTNDFGWSYGGNVTDSIKERVKKAGGLVENVTLRVSLSWFNYDDLDLHIVQRTVDKPPQNIYFGNRQGFTGGVLDVDMNVSATTRTPVENVRWLKSVPEGTYQVGVNNYNKRETDNVGFIIEIEMNGKITNYHYNYAVHNKETVDVLDVISDRSGLHVERVNSKIHTTSVNQEKWGLTTNTWVKVNLITLSPNYWGDNKIGNKHTFFIIEGAKNTEPCRGIYNEFLNNKLETHRKVFELIGDKTKCEVTDDQLSGLGFSSTKPINFKVKVQQGKRQRVFNVVVE